MLLRNRPTTIARHNRPTCLTADWDFSAFRRMNARPRIVIQTRPMVRHVVDIPIQNTNLHLIDDWNFCANTHNEWKDTNPEHDDHDLRDPTDLDHINNVLEQWDHQCGYWDFLNSHNPSELLNSNETRVIEGFLNFLNDLSLPEKKKCGKLFYNQVLHNEEILIGMDKRVAFKLSKFATKWKPEITSLDQTVQRTYERYSERYQANNYQLQSHTRYISEFEQLPSKTTNEWYPFLSELWLEVAIEINRKNLSLREADWWITKFHSERLLENLDDTNEVPWIPKNACALYFRFCQHFVTHPIKEVIIDGLQYVKKSSSNPNEIAVAKQRKLLLGYDSIINDMKNMVQTPLWRRSLRATFEDYYKKYKSNPIHRNKDPNMTPKGIVHVGQTQASRFSFWRFHDKCTFVHNIHNINVNADTLLITPGTFMFNPITDEYCLVFDVWNDDWTSKIMDESWQQNMDVWKQHLMQLWRDIRKTVKKPEINDCFHPKVRLKVLRLKWKYMNCNNDECDHFHCAQDRQLFFNWPRRYRFDFDNEILETIALNDGWKIGSLLIDGKYKLPDPNLEDDEPTEYWYWNKVIYDYGRVRNVLPVFDYQVYKLTDPFRYVRPGLSNLPSNLIVIQYTVNNDGITCTHWENGCMGFKGIKCNWWAPLHSLHSEAEMFSYALTPEHGQNSVVRVFFEYDVVRLACKGVEMEYVNDNGLVMPITLFAIPIAIVNDGAEVMEQTQSRGALNHRPDYFTSESRFATKKWWHYGSQRHWSKLVSQTV